MKDHAVDMQRTFEQVQIVPTRPSADEQDDKKANGLAVRRKELDSTLKQILTCSTEAWSLFKTGKMASAVDLCTDTLALLTRHLAMLQEVSQPALLNCMELQIAETQGRLKHMATEKLFNEDIDYSVLDIGQLKEALLLHSGLHSKTHYSSEDLANAFMVCWKSMKASPHGSEALRQAVLKNVQMLVFGQAVLSTRNELKDLFSHRIQELMEETAQPVIVDQALIEALDIMTGLTASQRTLLTEASMKAFKAWLDKKCESAGGGDGMNSMQAFKLVVDFQNTYGFCMNSEPLQVAP